MALVAMPMVVGPLSMIWNAGKVENVDPLDLATVETDRRQRFDANAVEVLPRGTWSRAFLFTAARRLGEPCGEP